MAAAARVGIGRARGARGTRLLRLAVLASALAAARPAAGLVRVFGSDAGKTVPRRAGERGGEARGEEARDEAVRQTVIDSTPPNTKKMVGQGSVVRDPSSKCLWAAYERLGEWGDGVPSIRTFSSCDDGATWNAATVVEKHRSPQLFVRDGKVYLMSMTKTFVKRSHVFLSALSADGKSWSAPKDIIPHVDTAVLVHNCGFVEDDGRLVFPATTTPNFDAAKHARRVDEVLALGKFRLAPGQKFARHALVRCGRTFGRVRAETDAGVITLSLKRYGRQDDCKPGSTVTYTSAGHIDAYGGADWLAAVLWLRGGGADPLDPASWSVDEGPANPVGHDVAYVRNTFGLHFRGDTNVQRAIMGDAFERAVPESEAWDAGFGDPYWMEPVLLSVKPGVLHMLLRINNARRCNTGALVVTTWTGAGYAFDEHMGVRELPGLSVAHPALFWDDESQLHWMVSSVHRDSTAHRSYPSIEAGLKLRLRVAPGTMCEADRGALGLFYSRNGGYDWHLARFLVAYADYTQSAAYPQGFLEGGSLYVLVRATVSPTPFGNHDTRDALFLKVPLASALAFVPLPWVSARPA